MHSLDVRASRPFIFLALTTALLTIGLIVFGAVVRVTDSGLGCGNEWPLCDGTIIPPLDNITAWIEWSHRLFAFLIGLLGVGMLVISLRAYRKRNPAVLGWTALAAVLFALQSALGALVVVLELPPTFVTLHLGTAMLLLGALLVAGIAAQHKPIQQYARDHVTTLAAMTAALTLVIVLTGALVRGSGATLACPDWPLCYGQILPDGLPVGQRQLATVHMFHRIAVVALGVALVLLVWQVLRNRSSRQIRLLAMGALGLYLAQALVGALFVWTQAHPIWGAAHVGLAAGTWSLLVVLCTVEILNSGKAILTERRQSTAKALR